MKSIATRYDGRSPPASDSRAPDADGCSSLVSILTASVSFRTSRSRSWSIFAGNCSQLDAIWAALLLRGRTLVLMQQTNMVARRTFVGMESALVEMYLLRCGEGRRTIEQELAMRKRSSHVDDLSKNACQIFGVMFKPATETWSAFNYDTLTALSEHRTESEAHAACRRYEAAALRRRKDVLTGLSYRAI